MRRVDREMPKEFALEVVDKCEWSTLSMIDEDNLPYCVPISIVRHENKLYFHSSKDGKKVDAIKAAPAVCISCVGNTNLVPEKYTTEYESAIIRGKCTEVTEDEEKIFALKLVCLRYAPSNMEAFEDAITRSLFRTAVFSVDIEDITGKRKKYGRDGQELKFGKMEE